MALDGGRINIGSCSLGGAALAFDLAKEYMHGMQYHVYISEIGIWETIG